MIRRSISQIFQTNSPKETLEAQAKELEAQNLAAMFAHLQSSRPRIQQPSPFPTTNPLNQTPSHPLNTLPNSWISQFTKPATAPSMPVEQKPRSQIEAMPPSETPDINTNTKTANECRVPRVILDPAKRHPVFFTDRFKKAPNGVLGGRGGPVSEGYVFEEGERREAESRL